jgi:hypothetical protein
MSHDKSLLISLLEMSDPGPVGPGPDESSRVDSISSYPGMCLMLLTPVGYS